MARNGCESDRPRDTIGIMISKWPIYFLLWGIRTFRNFSIDVRSYDIMIVPNFKMAHFVCLLSHMVYLCHSYFEVSLYPKICIEHLDNPFQGNQIFRISKKRNF